MLDAEIARRPDDPWLQLASGRVETLRDRDRARWLFTAARDAFVASGERTGEVLARCSLARLLFSSSMHEAGAEIQHAKRLAEEVDDPYLVARTRIEEVQYLWRSDTDADKSYRLLRGIEETVFPDGPYLLQADWLNLYGNVNRSLGRRPAAIASWQRLVDLAREKDDPYAEASALYNLFTGLSDDLTESPRPGGREEILQLARAALEAARAGGHLSVEAHAHRILSHLLPLDEAQRHFALCQEAARELESPFNLVLCWGSYADRLKETDTDAARALLDRAFDLATENEDLSTFVYEAVLRMALTWKTGPRARAKEDSQRALGMIEELRDLQSGASGRAGLIAGWAPTYYWLSGRLLEAWEESKNAEDLQAAFEVTERMRAQVLLDTLEAAEALRLDSEPPSEEMVGLNRQRSHLLREIALAQRRLFQELVPAEHARLDKELMRLEMAEQEIRERIFRLNPQLAVFEQPELAGLDEVRAALAPDEAFLSFQLAPWQEISGQFAGGSWIFVVTRGGVRVHPVEEIGHLRQGISLFLGLFQQRDGREAAPAARLYRDLLALPLAELPDEVTKLILVPDGILHRLPFDALRAAPDAPPLAVRYQITRVPSATLWLRWRSDAPSPATLPALVLADPMALATLSANGNAPAGSNSWLSFRDPDFGPLPYARTEGRRLVRHLGQGTLLRVGEEASERLVKAEDLRRFGVLHFAAHAVTYDAQPERSAIVLAAGAPDEDSLLQFREIVDLDLDGQAVVLSACRSASGPILRGEGVLDLARAFFQAGAHAVVGSLWRLRDDDAAAFFDAFYRHIARGASVAGAANAAQRERIADGAPAAAWAGLVVLGNGELVPMPGGRPRTAARWWITAAIFLTLAVVGVVVVRRRHRVRAG